MSIHFFGTLCIYTGFVLGKLTVHCLPSRLCNEAYFPSTYVLLYTVIYVCE